MAKHLRVILGGRIVADTTTGTNATLTKEEAQGAPVIQLTDHDKVNRYTLLMRDITVPGGYLHYLLNNYSFETKSGNETASYKPPSPPSGTHTYIVDAYLQPGLITSPAIASSRGFTNDNMQDYVQKYGLKLVARTSFYVTANNIVSVDTKSSLIDPPGIAGIGAVVVTDKSKWFKAGSNLTQGQEKYCRCVVEVAAKQPGSCSMEKAWFEKRDDKTCSNPYAVCTHSVGAANTVRNCGDFYDYNNLPNAELEAYANLKGLGVANETPTRSTLIDRINKWKAMVGH